MLRTQDLLDLSKTLAYELFKRHEYPWEVLDEVGNFILTLGKNLPEDRFDRLAEDIWVAKSAEVFPSAFLKGPLIVDEGAQIRHCAFIRGIAVVGKQAVVGNSTELKNAILFDGVQVPHFNYVGDSVLGYHAHFGAGAVTSNFKNNSRPVAIKGEGFVFQTGRRKLGAIVGDQADVGCNTVLNPGVVLGRGCIVYPLSNVRGFLPENTIYKGHGNTTVRLPDGP